MRISSLFLCIVVLYACGEQQQLKKYHNLQDQQLADLLGQLKKDPANKQALEALPYAYQTAMTQKAALIHETETGAGLSGERWESIMKEWEVAQQLNNETRAIPGAAQAITQWYNFDNDIATARQKATEAYYSQGLEYLLYQNRPYAQQALEQLQKANRLMPGYKDVSNQLRMAEDLATIKVVVDRVDYYNQSWNYWGYNRDYLQWRLLNDLNARSYRNVKFYTVQEARSRNLHPDKVVELDFTNMYVGNPFTDRYSYTRSKEITKPGPSPRDSKDTKSVGGDKITVKATVYVTKRLITGNGILQCRIFDAATRSNLLYDNFPGNYQWMFESATYSGDQRALEPRDWELINNRFSQYPSRNDVAKKIVEDSYNIMISRIISGVRFE